MSNAKRKWHCPYCSQDSSRHWNLKMHIKRQHNGRGEPIDEEVAKEFQDKRGYQFFSYNQPYGVNVNDMSLGSRQRKEKEQDIIELIYQIVIEEKEKLRKIKEIKSFFNELYSSYSPSSSYLQRSNIITGLGQTPIIDATIPPPVTRTPLEPTTTTTLLVPAPLPQEQEQKKTISKLGTDLFINLFITSTLAAEDFDKRSRAGGEGEDSIIIPQEPSLPRPLSTATSGDNKNNNNGIRREESKPMTENTKEEEDRDDIEKHPSPKPNLVTDDDGGGVDHVYSDYDDGEKWLRKKDIHGDINDMYKVITGRLLETQGYYSEVKRKVTENIGTKRKSIIRCIREGKRILKKSWIIGYYI